MIDRETNPRVSGAAGWLRSWPTSRQKPGNPPRTRAVLQREIGFNAAGSIHVILAVDSSRVEPSSFLRAQDEPSRVSNSQVDNLLRSYRPMRLGSKSRPTEIAARTRNVSNDSKTQMQAGHDIPSTARYHGLASQARSPARKSSNGVLSPRLFSETSPSASTSKGLGALCCRRFPHVGPSSIDWRLHLSLIRDVP
jgi:hypothetical protein